ncbi:hypothetical protein [Nocardioides sp. ChNu-99]|uniref:hypothetical protein n=1 Tax=Nocardioides sp. ChNu-99 TaxID=2839897 RepID=UPI00240594EC|nr:hypothetical protein [Nocardioides sp. ChNu-99]MDF9716036.1 hypothetical protein [Nocardioides sp. ChNu-99]
MSRVGVVIDDGQTRRVVTQAASRLSFSTVAPGGFQRASMTLALPRDAFTDLGPADRIYITHPRTGETLWEGWTEAPGPLDGRNGQSWQLTAAGNAALASDKATAWVGIDTELGAWVRDGSRSVPAGAMASIEPVPTGGAEGLLVGFNQGEEIDGAGIQAAMAYRRLGDARQEFASIVMTLKSGKYDTGYRTQLVWTPPDGAAHIGSADEINTTWIQQVRVAGAGEGHPPLGVETIALRLVRTNGDAVVPDGKTWSFFTNIAVTGIRLDRYGNRVPPTAYTSPSYVLAHEVAADIVGRLLPLCSGDLAYIEAPADPYHIDQMVFTDAVTARDEYEQLMAVEPDMIWMILETVPGRGIRSEWRSWGSTHRYALSTAADSVELTGGDVELCNEIVVEWTDTLGRTQSRRVTTSVPALDEAKRIKSAPTISLRAGMGSAANAERAGQLRLALLNTPTPSGTARVRRKVVDRHTGTLIDPCEMKPGYTARIREKGDVVRITEADYDDDGETMGLTLGTPASRRQQQDLARLTGMSGGR